MSRPEGSQAPQDFYDDKEARKYNQSSRMINIQSEISERAIEMLALPDRPCYILDVGCGSGLSGEALEEAGHYWVVSMRYLKEINCTNQFSLVAMILNSSSSSSVPLYHIQGCDISKSMLEVAAESKSS